MDLSSPPREIADAVMQVGTIERMGRVPALLLTGRWPHRIEGERLEEVANDPARRMIHGLAGEPRNAGCVQLELPRGAGRDLRLALELVPEHSDGRLEEVVGTACIHAGAGSGLHPSYKSIGKQIARDIHDGIGQLVTAIRLLADDLVDGLEPAESKKLRYAQSIERLARRARSELSDLRAYWETNGRETARIRSLHEALTDLAERIELLPGIEASVQIDEEVADGDYPPSVVRALQFFAEEAVTNALRHSNADKIMLNLGGKSDVLTLRVADNGKGPTKKYSRSPPQALSHLRERMKAVGGDVFIGSKEGVGTEVRTRVPLLN